MSMNIYYVANARMPNEKAHGIQIAKMVESFLEIGHSVTLVIPRRKGANEDISGYYSLRRTVRTKSIPVLDLYDRGRFLFFISSLTFMVASFLYLVIRKRSVRIDAIYTIDMDNFSSLFLPFLGIPCFTEMHSDKKRNPVTSAFFRKISGIIAINAFIKQELIKNFSLKDDKFIIEPNAVDIRKFDLPLTKEEARIRLNLPQDKDIALYVGRAYAWKGLETLIGTGPCIADIYVVGTTPAELSRITGTKILPAHIVATGHAEYRDIPVWMKAADLLLLLGTARNKDSYSYTSPMKAFEYMASGKPILASDTPANRFIFSQDEAAWYEPDNTDDFYKKLEYYILHHEESRKLAEAAKMKSHSHSWTRRAENIVKFISKKHGCLG